MCCCLGAVSVSWCCRRAQLGYLAELGLSGGVYEVCVGVYGIASSVWAAAVLATLACVTHHMWLSPQCIRPW